MTAPVQAGGTADRLLERAEVGFYTLSTADGLSNNTIMALQQDQAGFIWIGTLGGLNRYDGYRVRTFDHDPANPRSLPNGFVRVMLPGPDGGMWLGTHTAGVAYYDPRQDGFTTIGAGPDGLGHVQVYGLTPDGEGGVWVSNVAGLDRVSRDLVVRERVRHADNPGFPEGYAFSVLRDSYGNLWAGTEKGVARRSPGVAQWTPIVAANPQAALTLSKGTWTFFEDSQGRMWIGTNGGGVVSVAPGSDQAESHLLLTGTDTAMGRSTVRGIAEVRPGILWMALFGGGIAEYDIGLDRLRLIQADNHIPQALKGNFLRGILHDRGGMIWVATNLGVARHNPVPSGVASIAVGTSRGFSGRDVWSLWSDDSHGLWLGLDDGGLDRLDLGDGRITPFGHNVAPDQLGNSPIYAVKGSGDGHLWFGSVGVSRLILGEGKPVIDRPAIDGLDMRDVTVQHIQDGHLWIGTYYGLVRYRMGDGQTAWFATNQAQPDSLSNNDVWAIHTDAHGRLWVGTANGLNLWQGDGKFLQIHRQPDQAESLPHNYVAAIVHDREGRIWVGTVGGGVAMMQSDWQPGQRPRFRTVDRRDGLPSNTISSLILGKDGRIWVGTDNGLAAIDPVNFTVTPVEQADTGTVNSYLPGSVTTLADGSLVFGGTNGITLVQPDQIHRHRYQDALAVTGLSVGGRSVNAAAYNLADGRRSIDLPAGNRRLAVEFSLLDHAVSGQIHYAYRLDGFESDWQTLSADQRAASYTNLPPGSYSLHLRANGRDGRAVAVRAIMVNVPHLWYEWPLVRLMGVLLALAAGAGIVMAVEQARIAKLSQAKRDLETKVAERTQSLMEANNRLAELATRDPLTDIFNRRAFMERLDQEWSRSMRYGQPFCVLLMDLDHFKQVNDTYGHLVGDAVIKEAARRTKAALRDNDLLARYGGEELVVLTTHTDLAMALLVAERIRIAIGGTPIALNGASILVTVSIGVAQANPKTESAIGLFNRADNALYSAKAAGRNRVMRALDGEAAAEVVG